MPDHLPDPWREALLETSLDCVIIMDAAGRLVDFNEGTATTFGLDRDQTIGRLLGDVFVPPELRERHRAGMARYLATGESDIVGTRVEVPALHASGRRIPIELAIVRLRDTDPPLFVGHLRPIEARLRSERRLQVSAAVNAGLACAEDVDSAVRNTLAALGDALGWVAVQFWSANEGRSTVELRAWWDRPEPAVDASALRSTRTFAEGVGLPGTVLATREAVWIEDVAASSNFPRVAAATALGIRTAIGLPIDVRGRVVAVIEAFGPEYEARDEELLRLLAALGSQLGHFIEETSARTALAQSEARYHEVLASLQDGFSVLDADLRYLYANRQAAEWARLAPDEIMGRFLWDVFPSICATPFVDAIRRSQAERRPVTVEGFHVDLDRWMEARIYPHSEGTALFVRDISKRKRGEAERAELLAREREANRVKDEFLAVVSHELRTPLSPIIGWARLLQERPASPEQTRIALQSIERNALLEAQLVEDLLDVSRIMAGKLTIAPVPTDVAAAILAALDTGRGPAAAKTLQLSAAAPSTLPPVFADPKRLQQILSNLVSNAIKFTPDGGTIAIVPREAGDQVEIVVRDSGMGIDPAFLPHVFDRFRQADSRTTSASGGLGLGLSIVRDLVAAHGGSVVVTSDGLGHGTTVTVRLPKA